MFLRFDQDMDVGSGFVQQDWNVECDVGQWTPTSPAWEDERTLSLTLIGVSFPDHVNVTYTNNADRLKLIGGDPVATTGPFEVERVF